MAAKFPEDPLATPDLPQSTEEFINCLICTEPYEDPKVLPCQHTFCRDCLDKYLDAVQQEGTLEPGTLPCPVCRQIYTASEMGLKSRSGSVLNLVEKFMSSAPKGTKRVHCDVCKYKRLEVVAKDHCPSCGINYCGSCTVEHSKHCLFQNHSVVPITQMDKSSLRCESHDAEMVKYYCMTCMAPLCTVCAVTEHQAHDTHELTAALGNKKETILNKIGGMSEKVQACEEFLCMLEDIQSLKEAAVKKTKMEIERHINDLIGQLHVQKHRLIEELELTHDTTMKQIALEKENAAFQLANMKSLWKFAAKLTEPSQMLQMLAMYTDIMQMIQTMEDTPDPALPRDCVMMNMFMPKNDLAVGSYQKHELSKGILSKFPTSIGGMSNGIYSEPGASGSAAAAAATLLGPVTSLFSRAKSPPPTFLTDKLKYNVSYLNSPKLVWKIDKIGAKQGEINEVYDVAMLPDGSTVIAEWMNQRLQLFDDEGHSVSIISAGQIQPWGLTVTREGNLAITDDRERSVKILSPTGQIICNWKKQAFGWPRGVSENGLGQYIVTDTEHGKHTVSIHLPDGRCIRRFGSQGSGNSQFHWPRYVAVDYEDRILVSDGSNHAVKVFDASGQFLFKFGSSGKAEGLLKHPRGICVDPANNIVVADQDNNRVSMFNSEGKFVRHLLSVTKPWGVAISDTGLLAVTQKPSVSVYRVFDNEF